MGFGYLLFVFDFGVVVVAGFFVVCFFIYLFMVL